MIPALLRTGTGRKIERMSEIRRRMFTFYDRHNQVSVAIWADKVHLLSPSKGNYTQIRVHGDSDSYWDVDVDFYEMVDRLEREINAEEDDEETESEKEPGMGKRELLYLQALVHQDLHHGSRREIPVDHESTLFRQSVSESIRTRLESALLDSEEKETK